MILKQFSFITLCFLVVGVMLSIGTGQCATKLGQSCALTGPTSILGIEMHKGAKSYFEKHAPDIILDTKDDGYEPTRCITNTKQFIKEEVQALFGYVGTPTSKVAVPLATQNNILFFGAFTGASFLRDVKKNPYSFSVRGSYNAEIENMMYRLKNDLGISKVGIFVQRDAFGLAGVRGALRAEKLIEGIEIYPKIPEIPNEGARKEDWNAFWKHVPNYRRNTVMVGQGVRQVKGNRAEAVILVGAYTPCATAINKWHKMGFKGPMINISFVGSTGLAKRLKSTENVYISQVVPNPWDSSIAIVKEYQSDLGDNQYGFISLEGYIAAKILHKATQNITGSINSRSLKSSLETMSNFDVGGIDISFSPDDHQGMDSVYLTSVRKAGGEIQFSYLDSL